VTALVSLSEHFAFSLGEDFARNTLSANTFEHKYPRRNAAYSFAALRYSTPRFALTASALHTYVADRVRTGDAPPARSRLSPAAALSVRPFEESTLRLRASVKEVYRIPTFNDMYYLVIGNSDLRPERARQAGLGLTWSGAFAWLDYVSLAADGYYNRIADKIVAIPTMFIWKMSNADKAEGWGTDLTVALEKRLAPGWSLAANGAFSWMRAVDISSPSASNYRHQLPYTPRRSGTASADLTTPWLTVGYSVSAASSRYRAALNEPANLIAPYADHSLSLTRTFRLRRGELTLQGSVSNLTNTNYEIIKYYPMAPRNYRAGLKYSF
jgi:outer membrane cobalamin receptor